MAYHAPPTWGSGPWEFSDANTYIRDNFNSTRNYQTAKRIYSDTCNLTTTLTTVVTHGALCTVAPDESSELLLMVTPQGFVSSTGTGVEIYLELYDQAAALIGTGQFKYGGGFWPVGCAIGGGSVSAGSNPGFSLKAKVDNGTMTTLTLRSMAIVGPFG